MKAIVIDAVARTVEYQNLTGITAIVDYFPNGPSFCGNLPTGDAVYVDDEALLNPATHFVLMPHYDMPLPMKVLITGPDANDGDSVLDVRIKPEAVATRWVDRAAFEAWANDRARGPAIAINGQTLVTWAEMAAKSRPGAA